MCGEKPHGSSGFFRRWDYPRVCGEKSRCGTFALQIPGSPPRVRGKVFGQNFQYFPSGITPACAGKRKQEHGQKNRSGDHPRVCGEKGCWKFSSRNHSGSPPRMRGKAPLRAWIGCAPGITPAYAGKRPTAKGCSSGSRDYPRVCGEKSLERFRSGLGLGSPPRMRGKGGGLPRPRFGGGITPAYAGKRLKRSHSIGHFSCILGLFHSVLHRASVSGGSRAGPCAPPCLPAQNAVPV